MNASEPPRKASLVTLKTVLISASLAGTVLADGLVSAQHGATGVSFALHGENRATTAATVKIGKLTLGAQRRGVFRIGLLPLAIAESLEIRFRRSEPGALQDLPETFAALAKTDVLSIRGFALYLPGSDAPALQAETVEVDGDEPWKLTGLTLADGSKVGAARLEIEGEHSGRLIREDGGQPKKLPLFPARK